MCYIDTVAIQRQSKKTAKGSVTDMDDNDFDTPLSETSVSLKLELIQKRCSELMEDPDSMLELALEEPAAADSGAGDPYNRRKPRATRTLRPC